MICSPTAEERACKRSQALCRVSGARSRTASGSHLELGTRQSFALGSGAHATFAGAGAGLKPRNTPKSLANPSSIFKGRALGESQGGKTREQYRHDPDRCAHSVRTRDCDLPDLGEPAAASNLGVDARLRLRSRDRIAGLHLLWPGPESVQQTKQPSHAGSRAERPSPPVADAVPPGRANHAS